MGYLRLGMSTTQFEKLVLVEIKSLSELSPERVAEAIGTKKKGAWNKNLLVTNPDRLKPMDKSLIVKRREYAQKSLLGGGKNLSSSDDGQMKREKGSSIMKSDAE